MIITFKNSGQTLGQLTKKIKEKTNGKICYIGRLDPIASGLVCYLTNDECKIASQYMKSDKTYTFNLILGMSTDTGDALGIIKQIRAIYDFTEDLSIFSGLEYEQKYPIYSSYVIEKGGMKKPLWYYAKFGPELKEDEIPDHKVKVYILEKIGKRFVIEDAKYFMDVVGELDDKKGEEFRKNEIMEQYKGLKNINLLGIPMLAKVSSGTYIRKLCEDIGDYFGVPAMADKIERISYHF